MSASVRRRVGAAAASGVLLTALPILCFLPPISLLQIAANRRLPESVRWDSLGREQTRHFVQSLEVEGRPVSLRAERVALTHSLPQGVVSGKWRFEARSAALIPADARWPKFEFKTGEGRWIPSERKLELRDWISQVGRMNADLEWSAAGLIQSARIWGDAEPQGLREALSAWRILKAEESDAPSRLPFELRYEKGLLLIQVNHKPFFKASWRSDGAF